jgi:hypothetical protein
MQLGPNLKTRTSLRLSVSRGKGWSQLKKNEKAEEN